MAMTGTITGSMKYYALAVSATTVNVAFSAKDRGLEGIDKIARFVMPCMEMYEMTTGSYSKAYEFAKFGKELASVQSIGKKYKDIFFPKEDSEKSTFDHLGSISSAMSGVMSNLRLFQRLDVYDAGEKCLSVVQSIGNERIYTTASKVTIASAKNCFLLINLVVIAKQMGQKNLKIQEWVVFVADKAGHKLGLSEGNTTKPKIKPKDVWSHSSLEIANWIVVIGKIALTGCALATYACPAVTVLSVAVGGADLILFFIHEYRWTTDPKNGYFPEPRNLDPDDGV